MNNAAKTKSTVGEIVNMMSVDAQRILDMMGMLFFAITTPVQFIWSIALIYVYVGQCVRCADLPLCRSMCPFC